MLTLAIAIVAGQLVSIASQLHPNRVLVTKKSVIRLLIQLSSDEGHALVRGDGEGAWRLTLPADQFRPTSAQAVGRPLPSKARRGFALGIILRKLEGTIWGQLAVQFDIDSCRLVKVKSRQLFRGTAK